MNWEYSPARNGNVVQLARLPLNGRAARPAHARARLRRRPRRGAGRRPRLAPARLRRCLGGLRAELASLDRLAQAAPGQRGRPRPHLLGVADGARRRRGQDLLRGGHRLAEHALGLGRADGRRALGRLPPGLVARPLPGRHRADRRRRPRRRAARARLPVRAPAEGRRLVPAEQPRGRHAEVDQPADGRGGAADRARLAAARLRRLDLQPARQAGRELRGRQRPVQPAGALGEPGRLLAGHDRGRDRRPRDRRRHRPPQRRRRLGAQLAGHGRRLARQAGGLDGDRHRPLQQRALLPAADQGQGQPRPERGRDLRDRRQRPGGRPAQGRGPELPRARAPRREAPRRRHDPQHRGRGGPAARGRRPERALLLAPLQLRRLRRGTRTAARGGSACRRTPPRCGRTT